MSLYKDSSLAMIPSAVKDGKLYSIRPTDGSGDFTFSRGSNLAATRVDVNGLIEKGRENVLLQSNQFDTTWTTPSSSVTSGQAGYDGRNDAWLLNTTSVGGYIIQSVGIAGVQTLSVYAKAGSNNFIRVQLNGAGGDKRIDVNLIDGSTGTAGGGNITASTTSVGGGWWRIQVVANTTSTGVRFYSIVADGYLSGSSGTIYIQDAQLEQGLVATDYIETGASTAQAGILEDLPRLDYSGGASCPSLLLEPQRSNLITQSEYLNSNIFLRQGVTITDNATTSPEGLVNAAKLVESATTGTHRVLTAAGLTISGDVSISVYAKAAERSWIYLANNNIAGAFFDLANGVIGNVSASLTADIEPIGNDGWYRCTIKGAAVASERWIVYTSTGNLTTSYTGDGTSGVYLYGATIEQGSYPTSYIPTYGSAVTRSLDSCLATGVSDLIGQTQGTLFIDSKVAGISSGFEVGCFSVSDGTNNNKVSILQYLNGDTIRITITTDGVNQSDVSITKTRGLFYKVAVVYAENDFRVFIDGVKVATDTTLTPPSVPLTRVAYDIGYGAYKMIGKVKQTLVFPTALTDSECIALTA